MAEYNFWAHLLDTYQSLNDVIKALWVIIPPLFVLAALALLRRRPRPSPATEPSFVVHRTPRGSHIALPHALDHEVSMRVEEQSNRRLR